jgi:hypothetical protein
MLAQREAVPILLPLAVAVLVDSPLAGADFYPGDLLTTVLRLPSSMWVILQDERNRLTAAVSAVNLDRSDLPPQVVDAVMTANRTPFELLAGARPVRPRASPARQPERRALSCKRGVQVTLRGRAARTGQSRATA